MSKNQTKVLNLRFLICVLVLAVSIFGVIALWGHKHGMLVPVVFFVVSAILLFLEPVCYVFSKKGIRFIYFFGHRKDISWQNVQAVSKNRSYGIRILKSVYTIQYNEIFRGRCVRQFTNILATPRLKACFKKYYVGFITGEDEPRGKKKGKAWKR